jgi:rsbT antagonist protein RsbS
MPEAGGDVARVPMQLVRGCVVASVQVQLSHDILHTFQQDLLERLRSTRARAVILDLSGVSILDSSDFESILRTLKMASLMSAMPVIVGLRAGIAASLVELGASLGDFASSMTLEQAFELVDRRSSLRRSPL